MQASRRRILDLGNPSQTRIGPSNPARSLQAAGSTSSMGVWCLDRRGRRRWSLCSAESELHSMVSGRSDGIFIKVCLNWWEMKVSVGNEKTTKLRDNWC